MLGGYGNFGARIAKALATDAQIELLIAGRDGQRARDLAGQLGGRAMGIALDASKAGFAAQLDKLARMGSSGSVSQFDQLSLIGEQGQPSQAGALEHADAASPGLVIHTAGPFQAQSYGVALAAAQAGWHYIDLADGRRFVCDFPQTMDARFKAAGRFACSGASSVPALSSAVVSFLCAGWQRIDSIDTCIAPAQTAPRGRATLEGVLSYCGVGIRVLEQGRWQMRRGWANPVRVEFERLESRRGALCDVPDLELFPQRFGVKERVMFRAALEVGLAQMALAWLAYWRANWGKFDVPRMARVLNRAAVLLDPFGSSLGGMVVRVRGLNEAGQPCQRAWHLAADDDHGPEIPCMAAIVLARRLARGGVDAKQPPLPTGAFACMDFLVLDDFLPEFARWGMLTETKEEKITGAAPSPLPVTQPAVRGKKY